jgi:hypothetical protein
MSAREREREWRRVTLPVAASLAEHALMATQDFDISIRPIASSVGVLGASLLCLPA